MEDFEQIEQRETGNNSFLLCENIPLLKPTLEKNVLAVQNYMLEFFNCSLQTRYFFFFTIEGHCILRIKVIPIGHNSQATTENSFLNLIDINLKLWKIIYKLLQQLPPYLELCKECDKCHCGPYCPKLDYTRESDSS